MVVGVPFKERLQPNKSDYKITVYFLEERNGYFAFLSLSILYNTINIIKV